MSRVSSQQEARVTYRLPYLYPTTTNCYHLLYTAGDAILSYLRTLYVPPSTPTDLPTQYLPPAHKMFSALHKKYDAEITKYWDAQALNQVPSSQRCGRQVGSGARW